MQSPHFLFVCDTVKKLSDHRTGVTSVTASGSGLSIADLVAVARHRVIPQVDSDPTVAKRVQDSVDFVASYAKACGSVYGIHTGVGGSAVTRTTQALELQRSIVSSLICGVLPNAQDESSDYDSSTCDAMLAMPESWVKGAMLLRLNTLLRGHSGCRWEIIDSLHKLLVHNITPCPPLRQSISASGDLAPLGYIASSLTDYIKVKVWSGEGAERKLIPASEARLKHGIAPIVFGPKEGLTIINGTAPSCAVGALALHDASIIAVTSQVLTAFCVEALRGTPESFDPFISDVVRPHPGQIEVARNIRNILRGSQLARDFSEARTQTLRQDTYALRTAPQWIGPHVEELLRSYETLGIEMNSTTDNPIVDVEGARFLHGGNFQATSVSVVMEKTRIALQHFGKLAYAQYSELTDPRMNRGLPPDLAASEPSLDLGTKSMDIAMAAYTSELSFISNTVTNHVQSAEWHNQSVNSLALISGRYTFTAIQIMHMILANHLWALCQAVDLRAMQLIFITKCRDVIAASLAGAITPVPCPAKQDHVLLETFIHFVEGLDKTTQLDSDTRFWQILNPIVAQVFHALAEKDECHDEQPSMYNFNAVSWQKDLSGQLSQLFNEVREEYFVNGSAAPLLGGTKHLYQYVRETLGIKMRKGCGLDGGEIDGEMSRIYKSLERGEIAEVVLKCVSSGEEEQ